MAETPQGCIEHQPDFEAKAWEAYTLAELGQWVHLLTKRAEHRSSFAKKDKDLHDARNYLAMMQSKMDEVSRVSLASFAPVILREIENSVKVEYDPLREFDPEKHPYQSIAYISWKIPDHQRRSRYESFNDVYVNYVKPSILSLIRDLKRDVDRIYFLDVNTTQHQHGSGVRQSIHHSDKLCIRLTEGYESGEESGATMAIEIAIE